jgi:hypothetical protein
VIKAEVVVVVGRRAGSLKPKLSRSIRISRSHSYIIEV